MFLRSAMFACAAAFVSLTAVPAQAETGQCEATSFRVYFEHGEARLNPMAREVLAAAAQRMSGCSYRELHVSVDTASSAAGERGRAIMAALDSDDWNAASLEPRAMVHAASLSNGPDYVDVTMTPYPAMMPTRPLPTTSAGA